MKRPNTWDEQHFSVNELDLGDMARASGFLNQKQMKFGLLEAVDMDSPLTEYGTDYYNKNLTHSTEVPYAKTKCGIINTGPLPWEYA